MSDLGPKILAEIADWPDRLEASCRGTRFDASLVRVLAKCDSTQDVARMAGRGAVVTAGRQLAGRGRLGRIWIDDEGAGMGMKFPNDVVDVASGAKIAGILVEASDDLAVIGIGVNVHRRTWPSGIHAMAIEELASGMTSRRIDVLEALPGRISEALDLKPAEIAARFAAEHAPTGCRVEVESGDRRVVGTLDSISPLEYLEIVDSEGIRHQMPVESSRILSWQPSGG